MVYTVYTMAFVVYDSSLECAENKVYNYPKSTVKVQIHSNVFCTVLAVELEDVMGGSIVLCRGTQTNERFFT